MIKNDRQYRITKAAAARFAESLQQIESGAVTQLSGVDPLVQRAEREALKSQLDDLLADISEYEALVSGNAGTMEINSLAALPHVFVRARIASGMSHKELAGKLGLKEQQIQRYEATDYQQASLSRLLEIAAALDVTISDAIRLPDPSHSVEKVFSRLRDFGISKDFVLNRLVSSASPESTTQDSAAPSERLGLAVTRAVAHVFGWTPADIFGQGRPLLDGGVLGAARFKVQDNVEQRTFGVYTFYAHFLALLLLKATEVLPPAPVPTDPEEMARQIVDRYGEMTFRTALLYAWDLGIPVLPLSDAGAFHGACWRVNSRNVIVLKQKTRSLARWLFDLLHELRHAAENPESPSHTVVEEDDISPNRFRSDEEKEASWFAGEVSLGGKAEFLVERCVQLAHGSIERLKTVVPQVATQEKTDTAALANYLAFRLSLQGENWWGAATNLQPRNESPWEIARDTLLQRVDISQLHGLDRELFIQALRGPEN